MVCRLISLQFEAASPPVSCYDGPRISPRTGQTDSVKAPMKPELLRLLRCPRTMSELVCDGERLINTDSESRLAYPIRQNIPVLVPDEATSLLPEEWSAAMQRQGRNPQTGSPA